MTRRDFLRRIGGVGLCALGIGVNACGLLPASPKPAVTVRRIGLLVAVKGQDSGLRPALQELGYVEGQNLTIEYRSAEGNGQAALRLAQELVDLRPEVIVAIGGNGPAALKEKTSTIPIVLQLSEDAVQLGLVPSLTHPGGNITGVTTESAAFYSKRVEFLRSIVPGLTVVGVLSVGSGFTLERPSFATVQTAAEGLGIRLYPMRVTNPPDDFDDAFASAMRAGAGAFMTLISPPLFTYRTRIIELAAKTRLPGAHAIREDVVAGGLMFYGADARETTRRVAAQVDAIFRGSKPGDMPVELPTKFALVVNRTTARTLGLTIPQSILAQATEVVE